MFGVFCALLFLLLVINTQVVEVGRDTWGSVIYRNTWNNHYYVSDGCCMMDAIVEDSLKYKVTDNIPNRYYFIREYSGLLCFKRNIIIDIIQ